jgi:hypothetical protein
MVRDILIGRIGQAPGMFGVSLFDPKGEAVDVANALQAAKIDFMRAASRAGLTPYPPSTPALTIGPAGR